MQVPSFFRPEALANRLEHNIGRVSILMPINMQWMAVVAFAMFVLMLIYICFAQVAEHIELRGYLDSPMGLVHFYPEKSGIVTKRYIKEGMSVQKGMPLLALQSRHPQNDKALLKHLKLQQLGLEREASIARQRFKAIKRLRSQKFVSLDDYQAAEFKMLDCQNRLHALQLALFKCQQNLHSLLISPITGIVSNIAVNHGQFVDGTKPLFEIIPNAPPSHVSLLVPTRYIAFIKKGHTVELDYDAYPARRYGSFRAVIEDIHQSVLNDRGDSTPIRLDEPYYLVHARLEPQDVLVNGEHQLLHHGLSLKAFVRGQPRHIWQWVLQPLSPLRGHEA